MKKIKFIILVSISLLLFGCGNDMSNYDKIELTSENIEKYLECEQTSNSFSGKTAYLNYEFYSKNEKYKFEDVSFDVKIQEYYNYTSTLSNIPGLVETFNVQEKRIKLDEKGNGEFKSTQSGKYDIDKVSTGKKINYSEDLPEIEYSNVKGYIYIPWEE